MYAPKVANSKTKGEGIHGSDGMVQSSELPIRNKEVARFSRQPGPSVPIAFDQSSSDNDFTSQEPAHARGWDFGKVRIFPRDQALSSSCPCSSQAPNEKTTFTTAIEEAVSENGVVEPPTLESFADAIARTSMRDDPMADRSARLLGAEAVAFGDQILFRSGKFSPDTASGRELIAHELTHVAHQSQTGYFRPQRSVAGNVLAEQFTEAMTRSMTDEELGEQIQLLRAHLKSEPNDTGAAENLATLEQVARDRNDRDSPKQNAAPAGQTVSGNQPPSVAAPLAALIAGTPSGTAANSASPLSIPSEGVDMPWVGKGGTNSSELGYLRDATYFWERFEAQYPQMLSPQNRQFIASGASPRVDATWLRFHPEHGAYMNDILEHHHVGQGSRAVPLPEGLHDAQTVFHPQRRVVGTPSGGVRPLPPSPTRAQHQTEINRHTTEGRIRGQTIDTNSPPQAPKIPPGSELAAVPSEQLKPTVPETVPVGPSPGAVTTPALQGPAPAPIGAGGAGGSFAKAFGKSLLVMGAQMAVMYLAREMQLKQLEENLIKARRFSLSAAKEMKAQNPNQQLYLRVTIRSSSFQHFIPLVGWVPTEDVVELEDFRVTTNKVDPAEIVTEDHMFDPGNPKMKALFEAGTITRITYTEPLDAPSTP